MSTAEDGGTVRYNVKDLLATIDGKLDKVIEAMTLKADRADVHELKGRVFGLEKQAEVARLLASDRERATTASDKRLTRKQQIVTSLTAILSSVAIVISGAHWLLHH